MPRFTRHRAASVLLGTLPFMQVWLDAHQIAPTDLLDATADMDPDGVMQQLHLTTVCPHPDPPCARRHTVTLDAHALAELRHIAASATTTQAYIDRIRRDAC